MNNTHTLDANRWPLCGRMMNWDRLKRHVSQKNPTCSQCVKAKANGAKLFDLTEYESRGKRLPTGSEELRAQLLGQALGPKPKRLKGRYLPADACPECASRCLHRPDDPASYEHVPSVHAGRMRYSLRAHYVCHCCGNEWDTWWSGDYRNRISYPEALAIWERGE